MVQNVQVLSLTLDLLSTALEQIWLKLNIHFAEVSLRKSPILECPKRVLECLKQEFTHINLLSNYSPRKIKATTEMVKAE